LTIPSAGTSSFCEARKALPLAILQEINGSLCAQLDANLPQAKLWRGHPVKAEDGTMELRIIRSKGPDREGKQRVRYVVTTLLDPVKYPAEEVASLYHHRWEIEVRFRDIKTTLGMEMLRTKSPEMIR
jgi:IS4 transposase